jgi:tRNA-2-methylthio-N6-dimethylallyladenosine synthase
MRSFWIETWGCQMNEHDSELLAGTLHGIGYEAAASIDQADVVLLNTCAIREKAEDRVYQALGELAAIKRRRPELIVGVCGCVAQMSGDALRQRSPVVDLVLGTRAAIKLPEYLAEVQTRRKVVDTTLYQDSLLEHYRVGARRELRRVKAFITVMEGCNKTCSYCIVPTTRGREQSRPLRELLDEVERVRAQGFREVEFLGQNVNAYRCPETKAGLGELLRGANRVAGLLRIRFTTSHPLHLSDDIIDAMACSERVCHHIHLPVQSGSDRILKAMRRGYDVEKYQTRIARLRAAMPDITLSTDVIVGFPGETAEDFDLTVELIKQIEFDNIFSFGYSARPGTVAAMLPDALSVEEKSARLMRLQAIQREIQLRKHQQLIGSDHAVIIEGPSRKRADEWGGRTVSSKIVNFAADGVAIGDLVSVRITEAGANSLRGELLHRSGESSAA